MHTIMKNNKNLYDFICLTFNNVLSSFKCIKYKRKISPRKNWPHLWGRRGKFCGCNGFSMEWRITHGKTGKIVLPVTDFTDYWVKFNLKISNIMKCPKFFKNIVLDAVGRDLIHTRQNLLASKGKKQNKTKTNWCPDRTKDYSKVKQLITCLQNKCWVPNSGLSVKSVLKQILVSEKCVWYKGHIYILNMGTVKRRMLFPLEFSMRHWLLLLRYNVQ